MDRRSDRTLRQLEDGRLIRLPGPSRRGTVLAAVAALVILATVGGFGAVMAGVAVRIVIATVVIVGVVIIAVLLIAHLVQTVLLPYRVVSFATKVQSTRRERALAASRDGGPPVATSAPNSNLALGLGILSLAWPWIGPAAIWYGRDALKRIRMSGGSLVGSGRARAGLILGAVTTTFFTLLLVVIFTFALVRLILR